jgi:hypothetical protein
LQQKILLQKKIETILQQTTAENTVAKNIKKLSATIDSQRVSYPLYICFRLISWAPAWTVARTPSKIVTESLPSQLNEDPDNQHFLSFACEHGHLFIFLQ